MKISDTFIDNIVKHALEGQDGCAVEDFAHTHLGLDLDYEGQGEWRHLGRSFDADDLAKLVFYDALKDLSYKEFVKVYIDELGNPPEMAFFNHECGFLTTGSSWNAVEPEQYLTAFPDVTPNVDEPVILIVKGDAMYMHADDLSSQVANAVLEWDDGEDIAKFINANTEYNVSYLGDSLWQLEGGDFNGEEYSAIEMDEVLSGQLAELDYADLAVVYDASQDEQCATYDGHEGFYICKTNLKDELVKMNQGVFQEPSFN